MTPTLSLVIAIVSLAAWIVLIFVRQVPSGLPNGLYAAGILLLVRWIALRAPRRQDAR
jgi:hypothetical protein